MSNRDTRGETPKDLLAFLVGSGLFIVGGILGSWGYLIYLIVNGGDC